MRKVLEWLFVVVAAILTFSPCLSGDFVFDDVPAILKNDLLAVKSGQNFSLKSVFSSDFWGDNITSEASHKSYRPLTVLIFKAISTFSHDCDQEASNFLAGKTPCRPSPFAFHLINVLLHALNSSLVYFLLRILRLKNISLPASLIFALHPVHTEPTCEAVGLADLAYSTVILTALITKAIFFPRNKAGMEIIVLSTLSIVAVLLKEQGIMLIPMVLAMEIALQSSLRKIFVHWKLFLAKIFSYILALLTIVYCRMWVMDFKAPKFKSGDNPAAFVEPFYLRLLNFHYQYALNLNLLLNPEWLCFDWAMGCVDLIKDFVDLRVAVVGLMWAVLFIISIKALKGYPRKGSKVILLALAWMILPFIPASNLFFHVGFVIAERNLYLSVLGSSILVSHCVSKSGKKKNLLFSFILVIFATKSFSRCQDWQNEDKLFVSGLKVCPSNAKVHYNIAKRAMDTSSWDSSSLAHFNVDRSTLAINGYETAIRLSPDYEQALNNLGNLMRDQNMLDYSRHLLERAVKANPTFSAAWMNLGVTLAQMFEKESAEELSDLSEKSYKEALKQRRVYPDCHFNLGNLFLKTKEFEKAVESFTRAIEQRPWHKSAWVNLIMLNDDLGRVAQAKDKVEEAIEVFQESEPDFFFHKGNIYGKNGEFEVAEKGYQLAIELSNEKMSKRPDIKPFLIKKLANYHSNLGVLYHREKMYKKASQSYKEALKFHPNKMTEKNLKTVLRLIQK